MTAHVVKPGEFDYYINLPGYAGYKVFIERQRGIIGPWPQCSTRVNGKVTTVGLLVSVNMYHCAVCIAMENMIQSIEEAQRLAPHENIHTMYCTPTVLKGQ